MLPEMKLLKLLVLINNPLNLRMLPEMKLLKLLVLK